MSLIIEDGSCPVGADSYVSVEDLRAFASARGHVLPEPDADCESLLIAAMDYLELCTFAGRKSNAGQALRWPRTGVIVDGVEIGDDVVPETICRAQMLLAIEANSAPLTPSNRVSSYRKAKIGEIEVEYRDASEIASTGRRFPIVDALLAPYLDVYGQSTTRSIRV